MLAFLNRKIRNFRLRSPAAIGLPMACVAFAAMAGCTPLSSLFSSSKKPENSNSASADRPLVSNAFAYARYVAINLQSSSERRDWNEETVRGVMIDRAVNSGIQPEEVIAILSASHDQGASAVDVGSTLQRIALFEAQHGRCVAIGTRSSTSCCEALAWPLAVLPEWKSLSQEQQASLGKDARSGDEKTRRSVFESWGTEFRLQGLKAWLSVCHSVVTKQPETLVEFHKSEWFQPANKEAWNKRLHARSRAKQGPRRIQTRQDGLVAVAETLKSDDCSVTETEVIIRRPDGALNFWVYDAGGKKVNRSHFPAPGRPEGSHETVEKPSPDACMGCHYDLKARTFDVLFPSADELNLAKTSSLPVVCRLADEPIADDN